MILLLPIILGCIALPQITLSVYCISRFPNLRLLSAVALVSAGLQIVSLLFAERILTAIHVPSSIDPVADGFEIAGHSLIITVMFVAASLLIHIVLLIRMNQTAGQTGQPESHFVDPGSDTRPDKAT